MYILCIHYIYILYISYTLYKKILVPETKTDSLGLHVHYKYVVPDNQKSLSGTYPRDQKCLSGTTQKCLSGPTYALLSAKCTPRTTRVGK